MNEDENRDFDEVFGDTDAATDDDSTESEREQGHDDTGNPDGNDRLNESREDEDADDQHDDDSQLTPEEEQRKRSWEGRLRAKERELREERERLDAEKQSGQAVDDDDGEDPVNTFREEYPEISEPVERMVRKELDERDMRDRHFHTIREAHPDFQEVLSSDGFNDWQDRQPSYIQESINRVRQSGTASEAIELFDAYKAATPNHQPSKRERQLSDAEAVKSRSRRPTQKAVVDQDDFDAAFDEAERVSHRR